MIVNVLGNDSDPNGSLAPDRDRYHAAGHGSTSVNTTTGAVTYTPASGYTGSDEFFYTVRDNEGALSSPAKVTVTITGNPPPMPSPIPLRPRSTRR